MSLSTAPTHHTLTTLPTELLLLIAAHLPTHAISALSHTSHTLHTLLARTLSARFRANAHHIPVWSAQRNNPSILRRALAPTTPLQPIIDSDTLLCDAVKTGREHIVRVLREHGVNPDSGSPSGMTPLLCAVLRHDVGLAQVLLGAGAGPGQPHEYFAYSSPMVPYTGSKVGWELVRVLK